MSLPQSSIFDEKYEILPKVYKEYDEILNYEKQKKSKGTGIATLLKMKPLLRKMRKNNLLNKWKKNK